MSKAIGYINATDLKGYNEQVNLLLEKGITEHYGEIINGKQNKETFSTLLDKLPIEKLVMINMNAIPLKTSETISFLSFITRRGISVEFIEHQLDMNTINLLEAFEKRKRAIKRSEIFDNLAQVEGNHSLDS